MCLNTFWDYFSHFYWIGHFYFFSEITCFLCTFFYWSSCCLMYCLPFNEKINTMLAIFVQYSSRYISPFKICNINLGLMYFRSDTPIYSTIVLLPSVKIYSFSNRPIPLEFILKLGCYIWDLCIYCTLTYIFMILYVT